MATNPCCWRQWVGATASYRSMHLERIQSPKRARRIPWPLDLSRTSTSGRWRASALRSSGLRGAASGKRGTFRGKAADGVSERSEWNHPFVEFTNKVVLWNSIQLLSVLCGVCVCVVGHRTSTLSDSASSWAPARPFRVIKNKHLELIRTGPSVVASTLHLRKHNLTEMSDELQYHIHLKRGDAGRYVLLPGMCMSRLAARGRFPPNRSLPLASPFRSSCHHPPANADVRELLSCR